MELQCDICFANFDLVSHRPKCLPCGHTICKECVLNPDLGRTCPTCRKDFAVDPDDLPDNNIVIRLIENDGEPPRKRSRKEDPEVQQLQRGVDAGRKVVEALRLAVPKAMEAVEALNRQLDTSAAQLLQLEQALEQQVQRKVGGDECPTPEQLQVAVQMEDSLSVLTTNECSIVTEEGDGSTRKAAVQLSDGLGDVLRPLLLQLQRDGKLKKADVVAVPATHAEYVGPPMYPALSIVPKDLDNGHLKVDDILRVGHRWTNVRAIRGLQGMDSDKLLRVLAPHLPHLEELHIKGEVVPGVMEVVEKLSSLKRLHVQFDYDSEYPDLPLQLEELSIRNVNDDQLEHVMSMPNLRSLYVRSYEGPSLTFPPSKYGKLLWLRVAFDSTNKSTMMSLVRAFASSLQTLQLYCPVNDKTKYNPDYYHSDLGEILVSCDLQALRRLVLERPFKDIPCSEMAACLLQQRTIRSYFPSSVEVVCGSCHTHPVLS